MPCHSIYYFRAMMRSFTLCFITPLAADAKIALLMPRDTPLMLLITRLMLDIAIIIIRPARRYMIFSDAASHDIISIFSMPLLPYAISPCRLRCYITLYADYFAGVALRQGICCQLRRCAMICLLLLSQRLFSHYMIRVTLSVIFAKDAAARRKMPVSAITSCAILFL